MSVNGRIRADANLDKYRGITQAVKYPENPILKEGESGSWDEDKVHNPMVVKDPLSGNYYMFYAGETPSTIRIGVAESGDGLSWTKKYDKNPVLSPTADWEGDTVIQPFVFLDARPASSPLVGDRTKKWVMYYSNNEKIGRAVCDLKDFPYGPWEKDDANPVLEPGASGAWDEVYVKSPSVFYDPVKDKYAMYYCGKNDKGTVAIGRAVSDDGVSWTKFAGNPVLESVFFPTVFRGLWNCKDVEVCCAFRYKGWVYLVYEGGDYVHNWHIGLAASRGGENFYRYSRNPILNPSAGNQTSEDWDSQYVLHPFILRENDRVLLYYSGSHGFHTADIETPWKQRIGVAFLKPDIFDRVLDAPALYAWDYDEPWKDKSIDAGDSAAFPLNCLEYEDVTVYFESDTSGTLTIKVDPLGNDDWRTLDTISSTTSEEYKPTYDFAFLKLSFDTAATVTAKMVARR